MTLATDDIRNRSSVSWEPDGKQVTRHLYFRAADEAAALAHEDCPNIGDALDLGVGSLTENAYCVSVNLELAEEVGGDVSEDLMWEATAVYKTRGKSGGTPIVNKARWRASFRPQGVHISHVDAEADQVRNAGGSGNEEAETWQEKFPVTTAINDQGGEVLGVDIDEMVEVLSIEYWKDPDDVEEFVESLRPLAGRTNNAAFEGPWGSYAAGEARLTGIEISQTANEIASVTVEISRRENRTVSLFLDSLGAEGNVSKEGWQYLWVRSEKTVDPEDESKAKVRSIDAFVATLPGYEQADFSALGISEDLWT